MQEYEFDLQKWIARFPLKNLTDEDVRGGSITGPDDVAHVEQLRAEAAKRHDLGPSVPTDVFVMGKGEPSRRDVTKINGLPYRPADKPWPLRPDGRPMTFMVQYRLAESKDITGDLPGDVLLMFVLDKDVSPGGEDPVFHYEWYPLGLSDLVTADQLPGPAWEFVTCYGVRHRSVDYVDADGVTSETIRSLNPKLTYEDLYPHLGRSVSRWDGMKIGGLPFWIWPEQVEEKYVDLPGRFLCSLSDVYVYYPWIDQPEPLDVGFDDVEFDFANMLLFRDGFVLNFSIDDEERLHWDIQFA